MATIKMGQGMVSNAPLSSAPGREYQPPILGMLGDHGGHVKREKRYRILICRDYMVGE